MEIYESKNKIWLRAKGNSAIQEDGSESSELTDLHYTFLDDTCLTDQGFSTIRRFLTACGAFGPDQCQITRNGVPKQCN